MSSSQVFFAASLGQNETAWRVYISKAAGSESNASPRIVSTIHRRFYLRLDGKRLPDLALLCHQKTHGPRRTLMGKHCLNTSFTGLNCTTASIGYGAVCRSRLGFVEHRLNTCITSCGCSQMMNADLVFCYIQHDYVCDCQNQPHLESLVQNLSPTTYDPILSRLAVDIC